MTASATTSVSNRDILALWLLAILAAAAVGTHGIVYWDAGDYVRLAIDGGTSGLALGRPLFLFVSRLVAASVDPASAEVVLRWFWTAVGATAAPAIAVLASRLDLNRSASIAAGVALALSPSFAHTNHQVLTDTPALALSIAALVAATYSHAIAAGLLLAAAIATRETSAVHIVSIALLLGLGRKAVLAMLAVAVTLVAILLAFPPPGLASWWQVMSESTVARAAAPSGVFKSLLWVLAAGPVPVVAGLIVLARRPTGRWLIVSVPALIATVGLLFYPDGSFSPRYVLATAPLAFFFAGSLWLSARPRLFVAALAVSLVAVPFITTTSRAMAAHGEAVMQRIRSLPAGAIVVPGHYCPQAQLGASIYQRRDLSMICPGWEWPADLSAVLDAARIAGHPVAVDVSDEAWRDPGETPNRDAARRWVAGKVSELVAGFNVVSR